MVNDIVADSITRIRNAFMRKSSQTVLYYSKVVVSILEIMKENGFIKDFTIDTLFNIKNAGSKHGSKSIESVSNSNIKAILVRLKYDENGNSCINEIDRISKPGRRIYKSRSELKKFKNGYGLIIVSSSKGIMSNVDAYKLNVGGEALCSIW